MFWWISRHQSKDMNGLRLGTVLQNRCGCVRSSGCNASYLRYIITFDDLYHHDFYLWDFLSMWETMHALNTLTWGMLVLVYFHHHSWVLLVIFFAVWETMHALNISTWGILVLGGFIIKMFTCEGFWLAEGYPGTQVIYSRTMIVFTCEHSDVLLVVGHYMCKLWHCCDIHLAGFGRCAKDDYLWMLKFSLFIVTLWSITCDHQR